MGGQMADVTIHIDENTSHDQREELRDHMLQHKGVMAAAYRDDKPHLMIIEYDPEVASSDDFLDIAKSSGLTAELIGL